MELARRGAAFLYQSGAINVWVFGSVAKGRRLDFRSDLVWRWKEFLPRMRCASVLSSKSFSTSRWTWWRSSGRAGRYGRKSRCTASSLPDEDRASRSDQALNKRLDKVVAGSPDEQDLIAAAYHLHNLDSALENSFAQISRTFFRPCGPLCCRVFCVRSCRNFCVSAIYSGHSYDFQLDAVKLLTLAAEWQRGREDVIGSLREFGTKLSGFAQR